MIADVLQIVRDAGEAILGFYGGDAGVEAKADDSPLTLADRAAHDVIVAALAELTPEIPVVSEEGELLPPEARAGWSAFWLVDPLDGTKEFLKQTGEFTVNVGLVVEGVPVIGAVFAPAAKLLYWTDGDTAWKLARGGPVEEISAGAYAPGTSPTLVASRDHAGPEVQKLVARHPGAAFRSMGSSLKFCLVAEGAADLYLRDVPTMEWDTAAAHAVLRASGATLRCLDGSNLAYNKSDFRNPGVLAFRSGADSLVQE